jgi:selenocysteine lyase/cysteine desulfurase
MPDRRSFIRQAATLMSLSPLHDSFASAFPMFSPDSTDEDFWQQVRMAYAASPTIINLNNGGVCPSPRATADALDYYTRMCNEAPTYYMWRILEQDREPLRQNLAALAGCDAEEIAINRNATEALNSVVFGLNLQAGDEVVLSKYDYPNMLNAWKQREQRDGIKLVWADFTLPSEDETALAEAYMRLFTPRTRVVHLTHIINWNGQVMPVRKVADVARSRKIDVVVDAAHSFALLDYRVPDLGADFMGTSLHKWLCGPFGSGMLWIKKDRIADIWPLLSNDKPQSGDIRKFETLGTRSFPIEMAIGYSLDLHNMIGTARKQQRLQSLKNYWMDQVADLPKVQLHTSRDPKFGCAIGVFSVEGLSVAQVNETLFREHKIHAVSIEWEAVKGVRITPNVYTTHRELDRLVGAIRKMAGS